MSTEQIQQQLNQEYNAGFVTNIEQDFAPPGLSEDIIRFISLKKKEPDWLLEYRLKSYRLWKEVLHLLR